MTERKVDNEKPSWWNRHINPATHGKTTSSADIYFTEGAMKQVAQASHEDAMTAYGKSVMKLEGRDTIPAWASPDPKVRAEARKLLEDYDGNNGGPHGDDSGTSNADYWHATGVNAYEDKGPYERAKDFAKYVDKSHQGGETDQLRAFADLGSERKFDFHATIGAMNELATDDVILLNALELTGKEETIKTRSEGGLKHPDTEISETFE